MKAGGGPQFVRHLVEPPKLLDLLDIVAGGNGTSRLRGRGIDPLTGERHVMFYGTAFTSDNQYRPVSWSKLIDGVFIPDGRSGKVQTDSGGNAFSGFPATSGKTYGSIWVRAAANPVENEKEDDWALGPPRDWMVAIGAGRQYMPENRGLLAFHANSGITFDLGAMRETYPGMRPSRFRATAGMIDVRSIDPRADGLADVWVIVDGRMRFKREKVRISDGAFKLEVKLGPTDRYLSLVATDGGNGYSCDCLVFGDPVLEMTEIQAENAKEDRSMKQ